MSLSCLPFSGPTTPSSSSRDTACCPCRGDFGQGEITTTEDWGKSVVVCETTAGNRQKCFRGRVCYSEGIWISLGVHVNNSLECLGNEFLFLSTQESAAYQLPIALSLISSNETQPAPLSLPLVLCQVSRILLRTRPYKLSSDSLTFTVAHKLSMT